MATNFLVKTTRRCATNGGSEDMPAYKFEMGIKRIWKIHSPSLATDSERAEVLEVVPCSRSEASAGWGLIMYRSNCSSL